MHLLFFLINGDAAYMSKGGPLLASFPRIEAVASVAVRSFRCCIAIALHRGGCCVVVVPSDYWERFWKTGCLMRQNGAWFISAAAAIRDVAADAVESNGHVLPS